MEIDTNPPPLDVPAGDGQSVTTMDRPLEGMQRINKEFTIPAELLE